jgi:trehalose 6-phosphate synthase
MRRQVLAHDVDRWARAFLDALAESHPTGKA